MAAKEPLQTIKAEVTCPICLELFRDPVTSECGHSFCRECIVRLCQGDRDVACPLCNEKLRERNLRPNRELKNIVESLRSQPVEDLSRGNLCERHRRPLQLYCKEDQTPICLACERSQAHRAHTVVPVEEAVQEHWETMKKQLEAIESTYGRLHPLVSRDRKHLSPSAGEEAQGRLKGLTDSTVTAFKVHTEGLRQRFEALASQPQPSEPDRRGRGRGVATRSELRECQGREPGSEPAAEKQEETGSHVGRVCEEAPTPKYGLDQTSLDPTIHLISSRTESAEPKVDVKSLSARFQALTPVKPGMGPGGSGQVGVSAVPMRGALRGHAGPGEKVLEKQETTKTRVRKEAAPPRPVDRRNHWRYNTIGGVDIKSLIQSPQGQRPVSPELPSRCSGQVSVSPVGRVALPPGLQGCAVEVTLDPATAHPWLVLSEDRKKVGYGHTWQDLPDNPERFERSVSVLGSEGFTSGRRYWEVEVEPRGGWIIGVARDSVQRKGWIQLKPDVEIWALVPFDVSQVPRKVGVYLDYEAGEVRFYNAETMALISSLTATFTGRLVPFFRLWAVGSCISLSPSQR